MSDFNTVTEGGYTVSSSSESPEQLTAILSEGKETEKPSESEAASILGKKGGEAAAAKRAEAAKEAKAAPEAEPAAEPDKSAAEEPEKPLGKPRDDPRARMLEATRKEAEAKRERDAAKAEAARLAAELAEARRARTAGEPQKPKQTEQGDDPEPDLANYSTDQHPDPYSAWVRDHNRWAARDAIRQDRAESARTQAETFRNATISHKVDSFTKRMDEAEKADPSFNEKVKDLVVGLGKPSFLMAPGEQLTANHVILDEIINSEHAPALTLYLAEHPEEVQRLQALPHYLPVQLAMAKLEARMEFEAKRPDAAPQAPALRAVPSQAKPPLRPVNGSPHTADAVPGPEAPYEEHKRYWSARDKASARR